MRALRERLLVVATLPHLIGAVKTCYNDLGKPMDDWYPCDPSLPTSSCCSYADLCLSNGLCLNSGSDNGFTIQGCTDQQWGRPCITNCIDTKSPDFQRLTPCNLVNTNPQFCCGMDSSCCEDSSLVFDLPLFSDAHHPATVDPTPSSPSTSASGTASETAAKTTEPGTGDKSNGDKDNNSNNTTVLGVGIGVGLGVGLPLIGVLAFFAYQFRKRNKLDATAAAAGQGGSYGGYPNQHEYPYGGSQTPMAQSIGVQETFTPAQEMPAK